MTRTRKSSRRRLLALPVALLLAIAPATPAFAAESGATGTSGYSQTAPAPSSGTSPAKSSSTPASGTAPATTSTTPSTAKTLPFTGLNLTWVVGAVILLMGAGLSISVIQRRQRHDTGR